MRAPSQSGRGGSPGGGRRQRTSCGRSARPTRRSCRPGVAVPALSTLGGFPHLQPFIILTADHIRARTHTVPVHSLWSASQPMTRWTAGAPPSICAPCGRGPGLRVVDLSFCRTFAQICSPSTLRSSDEPSVGIGLRSDLGAGALEVTTKPVSERLFAFELQLSCRAASRAHGGESSAG